MAPLVALHLWIHKYGSCFVTMSRHHTVRERFSLSTVSDIPSLQSAFSLALVFSSSGIISLCLYHLFIDLCSLSPIYIQLVFFYSVTFL